MNSDNDVSQKTGSTHRMTDTQEKDTEQYSMTTTRHGVPIGFVVGAILAPVLGSALVWVFLRPVIGTGVALAVILLSSTMTVAVLIGFYRGVSADTDAESPPRSPLRLPSRRRVGVWISVAGVLSIVAELVAPQSVPLIGVTDPAVTGASRFIPGVAGVLVGVVLVWWFS